MALGARTLLLFCSSLAFLSCQTVTEEPSQSPNNPTAPALSVPLVITAVATPIPAVSPAPTPAPTAGPAPTPAPNPTPEPTTPPSSSSCAPGGGSGTGGQCRREGAQYSEVVTAAIDDVVALNPELFNLNDTRGEKAYKVLDPTTYQNKVVNRLRQKGYCATIDNYEEIGVKENNSFAESYDIITSQNYIWRGLGAYQITCRPPWF
jgi:hypothetical protein